MPPKLLLIPTTDTLYPRRLNVHEVRLALIHHGEWQDPICCTFQYHSVAGEVNTNRSFSALSYVWGTSKTRETIQIDGHDHKISINLACAIRHLRDKVHPVLIWIDAICINQDNIEERNRQVAMMRYIYARSRRVIVFLGDGSYFRIPRDFADSPPPAPITFTSFAGDGPLISHFEKSWEKLCRRPEWYSFCTICVLRLFENVDGYKDTIKCIANGKTTSKLRLFELVRQFINSQWWQRVWVIQEITVPSEVVIQYGNVQIPWTMLASSASVCENLGLGKRDVESETFLGIERDHAKVLPVFARQVFEIERLRRQWKDGQGIDLLSLLQEFSGRRATDDRDKVFALLGLASDSDTIRPNYSSNTVKVYQNTVLRLIDNSGSLRALSGDLKRKNSGGIPTWIPDWSVAIDEPDRRRMQVEKRRNIPPRWRIQLVEHEQEYWKLVSVNAREMQKEIEAGKRKSLPKDIVDGLISYGTILKTIHYRTDLMHEQTISPRQEKAIELCSGMYERWSLNPGRFWSVTKIREFIEAHVSLPRTSSLEERYRLDIISCCVSIYWSRLLNLFVQKRQNTNHLHSILSDEEKEHLLATFHWHTHAADIVLSGWSWEEYIRETFPTMVNRITKGLLAKGQPAGSVAEEEIRSILVTSDATNAPRMEYILTDPMTFNDPKGETLDAAQLKRLSDLTFAARKVVHGWSRRILADTLVAIEETKQAFQDLINWHQNNKTESEDDVTTIFSTEFVFLGMTHWIRGLRDKGPPKFTFAEDLPSLAFSKRMQHRFWDESEEVLHMSSRFISTVDHCTERLITWVDAASRVFTVSQWALHALRCKHEDFQLRFATTLVGGLYEESPGTFRNIRRPKDIPSLWRWFSTSLLPRLCDMNPAVTSDAWEGHLYCTFEGNDSSDTNHSFDEEMRLATEGRVFFTTLNHGMGLGPGSMMPGDEVRILPGGNRPFVLRANPRARDSSEAEYEVIGDCFFLMDEGEGNEGERDSLQGYLPLEVLGGLLSRDVVPKDITLV